MIQGSGSVYLTSGSGRPKIYGSDGSESATLVVKIIIWEIRSTDFNPRGGGVGGWGGGGCNSPEWIWRCCQWRGARPDPPGRGSTRRRWGRWALRERARPAARSSDRRPAPPWRTCPSARWHRPQSSRGTDRCLDRSEALNCEIPYRSENEEREIHSLSTAVAKSSSLIFWSFKWVCGVTDPDHFA